MSRIWKVAAVAATAWVVAVPAHGQTAAPAPPLSPERYTAIIKVLQAELPLDSRKPKADRVSSVDLACRSLSRTDTLVAVFRATCRADTDGVKALLMLDRCKPIRICITAVRRYATAAGAQAGAGRRMNKTLGKAVTDPPCKMALRYRASELRTFDRLRSAATRLERALRSQSAGQVQRALNRFFRVDRSTLATHYTRAHWFRLACR